MLVILLDVTCWAMKELELPELGVTSATLLAVLAGAGVELGKPVTGMFDLIAMAVLTPLMPEYDNIIGDSEPHAGV